jgi:hypothetical protein
LQSIAAGVRGARDRLLHPSRPNESDGALGFGGTATPNVRCPPGAVC